MSRTTTEHDVRPPAGGHPTSGRPNRSLALAGAVGAAEAADGAAIRMAAPAATERAIERRSFITTPPKTWRPAGIVERRYALLSSTGVSRDAPVGRQSDRDGGTHTRLTARGRTIAP